jgi:hypothetical protein
MTKETGWTCPHNIFTDRVFKRSPFHQPIHRKSASKDLFTVWAKDILTIYVKTISRRHPLLRAQGSAEIHTHKRISIGHRLILDSSLAKLFENYQTIFEFWQKIGSSPPNSFSRFTDHIKWHIPWDSHGHFPMNDEALGSWTNFAGCSTCTDEIS